MGLGKLAAFPMYSAASPIHARSQLHATTSSAAVRSWLTNTRRLAGTPGDDFFYRDSSTLCSFPPPRKTLATFATSAGSFSTGSVAASPGSPRICVLGGGFGGLYTAVRLQSLLWPFGQRPQVTLVDKGDRFVFKPLLYEVVNRTATIEEVAPPFVKLLAPYNVNFIQDGVKSIEPHEGGSAGSQPGKPRDLGRVLDCQLVHSLRVPTGPFWLHVKARGVTGGRILLNEGSSLEYDWLVLSLGSESNTLGVPGAKEHAYIFNTIQDALQVQNQVDVLAQRSGGEVVVVGSGPAGVELSATVAERLQRKASVRLISTGPEILKGVPAPHRAAAERVLQRQGVHILPNSLVKAVKPSSRTGGPGGLPRYIVEIEGKGGGKQVLETDLVLWTAGSQPSSAAQANLDMPFPRNEKGAMKTDDTLRVVGYPRVFALGDLASAAAGGQHLANAPATAQVAFQQADYAAWNIWAAIHRRPLLPFKYRHLGDMMSLGRTEGAVTLPITLPRDVSNSLQSGPIGSLLQVAGIRLGGGDERGVTLEGSLGAFIRRAAYLYRQPTNEHRTAVGSTWLQQALAMTGQAMQGRSR